MAKPSVKPKSEDQAKTRRTRARHSPVHDAPFRNLITPHNGSSSVQKPSAKRNIWKSVGAAFKSASRMPLTALHSTRYVFEATCEILFTPVRWTKNGSARVYKKLVGDTGGSGDVEHYQEDRNERAHFTESHNQLVKDETNRLQNYLEDKQTRCENELRELINQQERETARKETEIRQLQNQIDSLRRQLTDERKKCEELSNRLSKALSSQLTDNNPNIADLSDVNRPTKLAEKFSELYDNEWTDAFEVLQKTRNEYTVITLLLTILCDCFDECKNYAKTALAAAKHRGSAFDQAGYKSVKENLKKTAILKLPAINELIDRMMVKSHGPDLLEIEQVRSYVRRCAGLCWLMAVQDPPMAIVVPSYLIYNKDIYRAYTKSGKFVEYVVWPAISIQEGGALLGKGTVQCCDKREESKLNLF